MVTAKALWVTILVVFWVGPHQWGTFTAKATTEAASKACMAAAKGTDSECLTTPDLGVWEIDVFLP